MLTPTDDAIIIEEDDAIVVEDAKPVHYNSRGGTTANALNALISSKQERDTRMTREERAMLKAA